MNALTEFSWDRDTELDNSDHHSLIAWFDSLPSKKEFRKELAKIESHLKSFEQAEIGIKHIFLDGIYAREIFVPAGTIMVGGLHTAKSINIVSQGDMTVATENGVQRIKAPFSVVNEPGTKRFGIAHTDTIWTTIIRTELTDVEEIERTFTADDYSAIELEG